MKLWPSVYRAITAGAAPLVQCYLHARVRRGKEDPTRLGERLGVTGAARPPGRLVWVHAASVGEAQSVLALVERLLAERSGVEVLMTTGTVASARLLADRLPPGARHQFVPVDLPRSVDRFLDHWRPDLAIWVESELWPNLLLTTSGRGIPMLLANGRLSARSLARWRAVPGLARPLLGSFALCLAQDEAQAARFRQLGARAVESVGDLKTGAAPLAADPASLAGLRAAVGGRPVWLASSTHPGEEEIVAAAHRRIAQAHPRLLTILVPRHPVRGPVLKAMLGGNGLRVARRGAGEPIAADTDIYLADTLGELGLFFRLTRIAFIGGSLVPKGGHNPFEAARLGCAILHGPDTANCAAMAAVLDAAGAALTVADAGELAAAVSRLLTNPTECDARARTAAQVAAAGSGAVDAVLERFVPWLDALAPKTIRPVSLPRSEPAPAPPARRRAVSGADARS